MKLKMTMLVLAVSLAAGSAFAGAPAVKAEEKKGVLNDRWLDICLIDNAREGQSAEVVTAYCGCMNSKMPNGEKLTVTQWEKVHPKEKEICSKEAGWPNKK